MKKTQDKSLELQLEKYIENLEEEVRGLRRQNAALRKELNAVNFVQGHADRAEYLKLKRQDHAEELKESSLKEKWICHSCGRASLNLHTFDLPNKQKKYYRACPFCNKRTKLKDYHDKVEGLIAESKP